MMSCKTHFLNNSTLKLTDYVHLITLCSTPMGDDSVKSANSVVASRSHRENWPSTVVQEPAYSSVLIL